jgi:uncharacterized membrane protein (DUF4010 family)
VNLPGQEPKWLALAVASGIGLLIGVERERHKGRGRTRGAAGLRSFLVASLLGALSAMAGHALLPAVMGLAVAALAFGAYRRDLSGDPGMTTELALLATFLLGVLCPVSPAFAAGAAAVLAIALAARDRLHWLVREGLSDQEVHDGLLLAACALVVLPLLPDRTLDPFAAFNPRTAWKYTVLIMSVSALGHAATRLIGARRGLALAGFLGGFASSVATHASMATRARAHPESAAGASAGAAWSSVATYVGLALVLEVASPRLLGHMALPLLATLLASLGCALAMSRLALRGAPDQSRPVAAGRAFRLHEAVIIGATISAVLFASALVRRWLGTEELPAVFALAGFADAHAASAAAGALHAQGAMSEAAAALSVLLAVCANGATKFLVTARGGGLHLALRLLPDLALPPATGALVSWLSH